MITTCKDQCRHLGSSVFSVFDITLSSVYLLTLGLLVQSSKPNHITVPAIGLLITRSVWN